MASCSSGAKGYRSVRSGRLGRKEEARVRGRHSPHLGPRSLRGGGAKGLGGGLAGGHISLPIHAAAPDHATGMCIWEGESVEAVRGLVESVVGEYSQNEYFELEVDGLPAG
jgi:hypothetical protein